MGIAVTVARGDSPPPRARSANSKVAAPGLSGFWRKVSERRVSGARGKPLVMSSWPFMLGTTSATWDCSSADMPPTAAFYLQAPVTSRSQEGADAGLAGDPAHDLAQQEALEVDVVGGLGARLPQRLLYLQSLHIGLAVEHRPGPQRVGGQHRNGRPVVEHPAHQDPILAVLGELRPIGGDRFVEVHRPRSSSMLEGDGGGRPWPRTSCRTQVAWVLGLRPGLGCGSCPRCRPRVRRRSSRYQRIELISSSRRLFSSNASTIKGKRRRSQAADRTDTPSECSTSPHFRRLHCICTKSSPLHPDRAALQPDDRF